MVIPKKSILKQFSSFRYSALIALFLILVICFMGACDKGGRNKRQKVLASVDLLGPIIPGTSTIINVPNQYNADGSKYTFLYAFIVSAKQTLIQQHLTVAKIYCNDNNKLIAEIKQDIWENFDFVAGGFMFDKHEAEASKIITSMQAQMKKLKIEAECKCYRVEFTTTFTVYRGTTIKKGQILSNVSYGQKRIGDFSFTNVKGKPASSTTWTFKKVGQPPGDKSSGNLLDQKTLGMATIDESEYWSVTDKGTFYYGQGCPKSKPPKPPSNSGYTHTRVR